MLALLSYANLAAIAWHRHSTATLTIAVECSMVSMWSNRAGLNPMLGMDTEAENQPLASCKLHVANAMQAAGVANCAVGLKGPGH